MGQVCSRICYIEAPCKINLHLRVIGTRPDGFHELESLFARTEFADSLRFELAEEDGNWDFVQKYGEELPPEWQAAHFGEVPPEKNLVSRAFFLFREKTGFKRGVKACLTKRIPVGAGLGGGSSDAASTLLALDCLAGTRLPQVELQVMAEELGSDVPFFLQNGAAWVSGRGEKLEKAEIKGFFWVVLVKPPFSVSTPEAFRALDKSREGITAGFAGKKAVIPGPALMSESFPPEKWPFYNDFLPCLPNAEPCRAIIRDLQKAGASFAGLSGSGSCCFGIFREKETAGKALENFKNPFYFKKLTIFLAQRSDPVLE